MREIGNNFPAPCRRRQGKSWYDSRFMNLDSNSKSDFLKNPESQIQFTFDWIHFVSLNFKDSRFILKIQKINLDSKLNPDTKMNNRLRESCYGNHATLSICVVVRHITTFSIVYTPVPPLNTTSSLSRSFLF